MGAVLIQFNDSNIPRVIAYASKALADQEKRYYQTEREALAIIWAVEKFRYYLLGSKFEIVTDCKVLENLFKPTSKPCLRIERWILRLQTYEFTVLHRPGKSNLADPLSRLALVDEQQDYSQEGKLILYVKEVAPRVITLNEIEKSTADDEELGKVKQSLMSGNWDEVAESYRRIKDELCQVGELVLRNSRIIIPEALQDRMIQLGHTGHPGIVAMKARMRAKVWFPNMDKRIEEKVKSCLGCLMTSSQDPPNPLSIRPMPNSPWFDIAIDFKEALPNGNSLLVAIDYFSRFVQVAEMAKTEASDTISALKFMFSYAGLPKSITADNGPQFTSKEFRDFCDKENIQLKSTAPYYPAMNGEVERFNRNIKKRLQISHVQDSNWRDDLADYLLAYNNTVHSTTGVTPARLFFGRDLRDRLPEIELSSPALLLEDIIDNDLRVKEKRKNYADDRRNAKFHTIQNGDIVLAKNQTKNSALTTNFGSEKFKVIENNGAVITIESEDEKRRYRRHASHLKKMPEEAQVFSEVQEEKEICVGEEPANKGIGNCRPNRNSKKPGYLKDFV